MVPFLLAAIMFSYFGLQRRKWQQGGSGEIKRRSRAPHRRPEGMATCPAAAPRGHASTSRCCCSCSCCCSRSTGWAITAFKPNEELCSTWRRNPFWVRSRRFAHIKKLLFETDYPQWLWNTMFVAVVATIPVADSPACSRPTRSRACASGRASTVGLAIFLAYLVPPSILFIPLATMVYQLGLFDTPLALILTYPTFLIPFCTWLLMGYFKSIPYELEECALIDGANAGRSWSRSCCRWRCRA
jgi:ABC-type glycerol-3-phosphate transport system permease component